VIIYLDESGDLGFNFKKNTPRYFVITLLACRNKEAANQFKRAVKRTLKNKFSKMKQQPSELKGTTTTLAIKKYFYRCATESNDWHIYSIVLDKHKLKSKLEPLPSEHRLYNHLSKEILRQVDLTGISQLLLVLDKRKGKQGINEFNKYLSFHLEAMLPLNIVYDISHESSHMNLGLQSVDIFCWGIHRSYEFGDREWIDIYEEKLTLIEDNNFAGIKERRPLKRLIPAFMSNLWKESSRHAVGFTRLPQTIAYSYKKSTLSSLR
jgi:hypothetical protein